MNTNAVAINIQAVSPVLISVARPSVAATGMDMAGNIMITSAIR